MEPTKPFQLVIMAVIWTVLSFVAVSLFFANLAPFPWTLAPALALCAIAELIVGRNLRARIRRRPGAKPIQPMVVPRFVALAKASSLAGAIFGGLALGAVIYTAGSLGKPVPRHDAVVGGLSAVASLLLTVAAVYLERSCQAPAPPKDEDGGDDGQAGRGGR